ncbi:MAG: sigma-54-dependent Fis family transcriptional regulator, partial [Myxococcales bacterium]|nr:sigma-54-dependent Fis family transcriptional regulator [Myxococcales bacterium]
MLNYHEVADGLPEAPLLVLDMKAAPPGGEEIVERLAREAGRVAIRGSTSAGLELPIVNRAQNGDLIGEGPAMQRVRSLVEMVGPTDSSVYLSGDTGTGKELVARLLHDTGPRRSKRMVCINCAALPDSLLESELFGHERGAFTGATHAHAGAFEAADGGTLFLDEIGDMSPYAQAKVLRALEDRSVRRVGATTEKRVDIRIIAASNADLEERVAAGEFRSDLYFRLNVVRIKLPSLRQRLEDVPLLAAHFLRQACAANDRRGKSLSDGAMKLLAAYDYPGNV